MLRCSALLLLLLLLSAKRLGVISPLGTMFESVVAGTSFHVALILWLAPAF